MKEILEKISQLNKEIDYKQKEIDLLEESMLKFAKYKIGDKVQVNLSWISGDKIGIISEVVISHWNDLPQIGYQIFKIKKDGTPHSRAKIGYRAIEEKYLSKI